MSENMTNNDFLKVIKRIENKNGGKGVSKEMLKKEGVLLGGEELEEELDRISGIELIPTNKKTPVNKTVPIKIESTKTEPKKENNNMTVEVIDNKKVVELLNKAFKDINALTKEEKAILNVENNDFAVKQEVLTDLVEKKDRYKSMKSLIDVIPVTEDSGVYSSSDNESTGEMVLIEATEENPFPSIPVQQNKLEGFNWKVKKYAAVSRISSELIEDSQENFTKFFATLHDKKQARTENKVIFATMAEGITPEAVGVEGFVDGLDNDINASYEASASVVTNQDGLKQLRKLPQYSVIDTDEGVKRYFDIYPLEVFSNDELPNLETGTPIFYGSFKDSVKLFEQDLKIKATEKVDFLKAMTHVRGIINFDVKKFDSPNYEYKLLPLE